MAEQPIFYDPEGRRGRVAAAVASVLTAVVVVVAFVLVVTGVFLNPPLPGPIEHRSTSYRDPLFLGRKGVSILAPKLRQSLLTDMRRRSRTGQKKSSDRIVLGYYPPSESSALGSLRAHAASLTHVAPEWLHLLPDGGSIDYKRDYDPNANPGTAEVERIARANGIRVIPILDNYNSALSDFDARPSRRLLADPVLQTRMAGELARFLSGHGYDGIHLDFEKLTAADDKGLVEFTRRLRDAFAPSHLTVSVAVEVDNQGLDLAALADACDFIVPMLYDEHDQSDTEGPIASLDWTETCLQRILNTVPEDKVVMGVGNYSYDWVAGKPGAQDESFQGALTSAQGYRSEAPSKVIQFDPQTSNSTYAYRDDDDKLHRVWMLDALSAYNQLQVASDLGIRGAAVWALGREDPGLWKFFDRTHLFSKVDPHAFDRITFPYEVSFEGRGEILKVRSRAADGLRRVHFDADGFVDGCVTEEYASPYVVSKSGYRPHKIALTFDDGPDPTWTPQILDALKRNGVKGTFFDIGANVESMPDLVRREYDEGHEVGNHSFTHPDIGSVNRTRANAEINLTQMAIEGATGHSSTLFRPPYNADSEPETTDQLEPVLIADRLGYITVGENVDPTDWDLEVPLANGGSRPKTARDIANSVVEDLSQREGSGDEGNIVLLHDAGGNRSQTVAALDLLIPALRAKGYEFVTVSSLVGKTRDGVMPPIPPSERFYYAIARWGLGAAFQAQNWLAVLFRIAVFLGIARVALITPLAVWRQRTERRPKAEAAGTISVVVAAYNEGKVIVRTVESILASDVAILEVIVVDDGSTDDTAAVLQARFADDPCVRVLSKPNGGKASALNAGIEEAKGDLLFHIDADTVLDPAAIGLLARHLADPKVAAVAGNVQVGNRMNLLTRWQDLEYVTSQNLDRRAYAHLNCITVVPGAIGMWRRSAVEEVGGYATDTLAEDMDLTWRLRRADYRLENEPEAYAFTEAPERFGAFFRQRFRWAYGTLQCLTKHRGALFHHGWFGWLALPTQWVFGVVFQALAPLVDLQAGLAIVQAAIVLIAPPSENKAEAMAHAMNDLTRFWSLYALFLVVEGIGAAVALRMERRSLWNLIPLVIQRFVYRQMMYAVMFKSLTRAVAGKAAGWNKLARTGSVRVPSGKRAT